MTPAFRLNIKFYFNFLLNDIGPFTQINEKKMKKITNKYFSIIEISLHILWLITHYASLSYQFDRSPNAIPFVALSVLHKIILLNWLTSPIAHQKGFTLLTQEWTKMYQDNYDNSDEKSYNRKRWALLVISLLAIIASITLFCICLWIRFDLDFWEWVEEIEW